jgi:serine/threonine protein kinase/tetratricopeptide (TPR) repeat protein
MNCTLCHTPNPESALSCSNCGSVFHAADVGATLEVLDKTSIPLGEDFGPRYQVLSLLGTGGMGKVYKAFDRELDRTVALKVLRPDLVADPQALQRFKQELLLASRISHPNILRIHDLGDHRGVKFISMAFVEGGDLAELLKREGRLPLDRCVHLMQQLCEALQAAHSANVVHRDLKPQNILVGAEDHLYVSDFGLAKTLEPNVAGMTRTGAVLGTPLYMSPEQVQGKHIDNRTDLYALGLIFYEMLTGVLPFAGESSYQLMYQRVHQFPKKPEILTPGLPSYISRICLRCLEKDPSMRYQQARDILADLRSKQSPSASLAKSVQITLPIPVHRGWLAFAAALLLLLGGLLAFPRVRNSLFHHEIPASSTGIPSLQQGKFVAVLPIHILGDPASFNYVADGLTEALTAKLFQLRDVHTVSSSAVQKMRPTDSLEDAARQLGVNLIVSGTLEGSSDKLRIVASLDDVSKGKRMWSEEFSGVPQDLLILQDQIYAKLIEALALKQTPEEAARGSLHPTENIEAYDLYLRGRNAMRGQLDVQGLAKAIEYFENSLKKDPGFALAYTGLADASLRLYRDKKDPKWAQKALSASQQAQRLDDSLPEVHTALGGVYSATGKSAEAIAELRRALELAPSSDDGYRRLGDAFRASGRREEAIQAYQKAIEVSPYYWFNWNALGTTYYRFGDNQKALEAFQRVTELEPRNAAAYRNMGAVYFQQDKWNECIPVFQKSLEFEQNSATYSNLGTAYFYLKRYDDALKMFEKAAEMNPNDETSVGNLADAYRWSGKKQEALTTYDRAITLASKDLQVNPRSANTMGNLALYYAKKGDSAQALEFIRHARSIEPDNISILYDQAVVNCLAGREEESISALGGALRKGYSIEAIRNDPEFAALQKLPQFAQLLKKSGN